MADLNKVMMIGNLTRDPQLKYLPNGTAVCESGLAVNHKYKTASGEKREEATFVDFAVFAKGGEIFKQYTRKGSQVFIEGRLKLDSWDDKTSGQKRSKLTVVVENFQFLGGKDDGDRGGQHESPSVQRPPVKRHVPREGGYGQPALPAGPEVFEEEQPFTDESIPF